jgi:signal peptide peptidase SppA
MPNKMKTSTGCRPAQLFGLWAIEPSRFNVMYQQAMKIDLLALGKLRAEQKADSPSAPLPSADPDIDSEDDEMDQQLYGNQDGIATVTLSGPLTKYTSSFQSLFGGTSTVMARRALRAADADDDVDGVMLVIDSPGGTVAGTADLAEAIAAVSKPCYAYIADLGASAAYWCAAVTNRVYCNLTAAVGCIGVLTVLEDTSKMYEQAGVKVHVITSDVPGGDTMKGAGTDGAPITDEQVAYFKSLANDTNQCFVAGIAAGRKMSVDQAARLADGRVHIGAKAQGLGLVDEVAPYAKAMSDLYAQARQSRQERRDSMWFGK